jgi:two-component system cell cycle sensor histidine kinase/response regulator CckA
MDEVTRLRRRIQELEAANQRLRSGLFKPSQEQTVLVPQAFSAQFAEAKATVREYFQDVKTDPSKGELLIGGQRYVLIRASSLSIDFLDTILQLYADRSDEEALSIGKSLLFDIAHSLGISDARNFHQRMGLTEPLDKLSAGPVHFAYSGWALVDIKPESNPVPGEDYCLIYDHPYSFEAASWLQAGRQARSPRCIMSAGYSSGWCEESFDIELTSVEVTCQAKGDPRCTFIMAPPHRIEERLLEHFGAQLQQPDTPALHIPTYFDRKHAEEALQEKARELEQAYSQLRKTHQELTETQAMHLQAGRLVSIGELAAGVAHELNSPLCVALGYANLLREELGALAHDQQAPLEGFSRKVSKIQAAAERCKIIVDDLLAFSRQSSGVMRHVRVDEVLDRTFDLIGMHFRQPQIKVVREIPATMTVWGNANQLQQVFTNIALNSAQAMEQGGELKISAALDSAKNCALTISDTGPGIDAEHQEKIFDPFFTTKPTGRGTGLGLSIVYGIVSHHNGRIVVDSPPGQGTTFTITIPTTEPAGRD